MRSLARGGIARREPVSLEAGGGETTEWLARSVPLTDAIPGQGAHRQQVAVDAEVVAHVVALLHAGRLPVSRGLPVLGSALRDEIAALEDLVSAVAQDV